MARARRICIQICFSLLIVCLSLVGLFACDEEESGAKKPTCRLDRTAYIIRVEEEIQLNVITKEQNPVIEWSSDDNKVATVSNTGLVKAIATGTTTINAVVSGEELTCDLTVKDKQVVVFLTDKGNPVESVNLSTTAEGEYPTSMKVDAEVEVNYKTLNEEVVWTSSNPAVATVSNGVVSSVGKGEAIITASTVIDGKTHLNAFSVAVHPIYEKITCEASFFDKETASNLAFAFAYTQDDVIDYVELNGKRLLSKEYSLSEDNGGVLSISSSLLTDKGRYSVKISKQVDEIRSHLYEYPFVYADYVIRSIDDLNLMEHQRMHNGFEYYVLASDLDFQGGKFTASPDNITRGVFDGYGHFISNVTISEKGDNVRRWGIFGKAASFGATIKDLAMINVGTDSIYGSVLGGTFTNAIVENVFVIGRAVPREINSMLVGAIAGTTQIKNCVVIDNSNLGGKNKSALGRFSGNTNAISIENVVAVTDGYAVGTNGVDVDNTDEWSGITRVKPASISFDEDLYSALKNMNGVGRWTFDEDSKTLSLWGRAVYTISTTVEAQFLETADVLTLDTTELGEIRSLAIDDASVSFENTSGGITFAYSTIGRHSAVVKTENASYRIPFVLADKVIRSKDDFTGEGANMGISENSSKEYIVLATDLDYTDDTTPYRGGRSQFAGTFDGYGHKIVNIHVAQYSETAEYAGLLASCATGATVKDLAVINATFHSQKGGLFGAQYRSYGTFENVFISGSTIEEVTENTSLLLPYIRENMNSTFRNCVVINNNSTLRSPIGVSYTDQLRVTASDTLFVGEGNAFLGSSGAAIAVSGITQVKPSSSDFVEEMKKALTALSGKGNWSFEENTLKLKGNAVYTLVEE